ncbi:hypothetical protein ABW19_dt0209886 [Dactylella cylindrospora]|nr:hypothetical protein ABW19_dt0209886 [Dactylella cylindrospora]
MATLWEDALAELEESQNEAAKWKAEAERYERDLKLFQIRADLAEEKLKAIEEGTESSIEKSPEAPTTPPKCGIY